MSTGVYMGLNFKIGYEEEKVEKHWPTKILNFVHSSLFQLLTLFLQCYTKESLKIQDFGKANPNLAIPGNELVLSSIPHKNQCLFCGEA